MNYELIKSDGLIREKYWDGKKNAILRYWVYLRTALTLVNEAKNYFLIVFGSYWTAKSIVFLGYSIDPNLIIIAGIVGIPALIFIGRWQLHNSKSQEYAINTTSSVLGYNAYNISLETLNTLKEINEKLSTFKPENKDVDLK